MPGKVNLPGSTATSRQSAHRTVFDDEQALADWVRRIYTLERRLQEATITGQASTYLPSPGLDGRAATLEAAPRPSSWAKIARFLIAERIAPVDYIARQFDYCKPLAEPLYPNKLLGDEARKRYADSRATKQAALGITLRSYRLSLFSCGDSSAYVCWPATRENRDGMVEGWLSVLYCDNALSPLFVYSVAMNIAEKHPAYAVDAKMLLRRHELGAAVEYVRFRRDYDAVWRELIPREFRGKAKQIYRDLLASLR